MLGHQNLAIFAVWLHQQEDSLPTREKNASIYHGQTGCAYQKQGNFSI
jgi:hypothetical protein